MFTLMFQISSASVREKLSNTVHVAHPELNSLNRFVLYIVILELLVYMYICTLAAPRYLYILDELQSFKDLAIPVAYIVSENSSVLCF